MTELTVNQVDVAKLKVSDDEILLVTTRDMIDQETAFRIKAAFKKAFESTGGNVPPILVMNGGLKVEIVKRSDLVLQVNETNPSPLR